MYKNFMGRSLENYGIARKVLIYPYNYVNCLHYYSEI